MRRPRKSLGFTLVEIVIALAILAVALFGSISVITYTTRMNMASRERMFAMRAAEKKIEQMLSCLDLVELYDKFSVQTEGLGWEAVDGLEPVDPAPVTPLPPNGPYPSWITDPTKPRRPTLFVRFPLTAAGAEIDEAGSGVFMGCYKLDKNGNADFTQPIDQDLNGNNAPTNGNPADKIAIADINTLRLLPVTIEVYWKGSSGTVTGNVKTGRGGISVLTYKYTFFKKT